MSLNGLLFGTGACICLVVIFAVMADCEKHRHSANAVSGQRSSAIHPFDFDEEQRRRNR